MPQKTALITGAGGQDGSYLAELLLDKGYDVHGLIRHCSVNNKHRVCHLEENEHFHLHYGDVTQSLVSLIKKIHPDEIYNLQSHKFTYCLVFARAVVGRPARIQQSRERVPSHVSRSGSPA